MAGGAETPNIAALPAIARLGADRKASAQHPRPPAQIFVSNCCSRAMSIRFVIRDHSEPGTKVVTEIGTTDDVLFKPRL
jgi:hypothetical protein